MAMMAAQTHLEQAVLQRVLLDRERRGLLQAELCCMQTLVTTLKPSVTPWHTQRGRNRVKSGAKGGRAQGAAAQRKGSSAKVARAQRKQGGVGSRTSAEASFCDSSAPPGSNHTMSGSPNRRCS